jgi:DNA/RNA-binding domain of Phe-tRNA-synthetase-like protein
MSVFQYSPDILARYPNVVGGVIVARGVRNGASSPELLAAYRTEQQAVLERIGDTPLSQIESLAAWRGVFRSFGVDPTQIRSACEALLRRLTKQGDIPSINALVDLGNLVSIRYGLPVAIVDTRTMTGGITVKFAEGTERFTNLGQSEIANPDPGEVIFVDDAGLVFARRWCWRQSDQSAAHEDTTDILVTVEAQHAGGRKDVEAAVRDLIELLGQYAGEMSTHFYILERS